MDDAFLTLPYTGPIYGASASNASDNRTFVTATQSSKKRQREIDDEPKHRGGYSFPDSYELHGFGGGPNMLPHMTALRGLYLSEPFDNEDMSRALVQMTQFTDLLLWPGFVSTGE